MAHSASDVDSSILNSPAVINLCDTDRVSTLDGLRTQRNDDFESEAEFGAGDMDYRGSSATGLTMKEYDESLRKLTAENFQLKLKIYFMDIRLSKMEGIQDKDLVKENVDLRVTNETQSKDLESKQKLLFEASEAFEQLQNEHKEALNNMTTQFEIEKRDLIVKLEALEASARLKGQDNHRQAAEAEVATLKQKVEDLNKNVEEYALKVEELNKTVADKTQELLTVSQRVQEMEEAEDRLMCKICELEENLKENEVEIISAENNKLKDEISALQNRLKTQLSPRTVTQTIKELEERELTLKTQVEELETRCAEMTNLEGEHKKACATIKSLVKKIKLEGTNKERLVEELRAKDDIIAELNGRLPVGQTGNQQNSEETQILKIKAEIDELSKRDDFNSSKELMQEVSTKRREIEKLKGVVREKMDLAEENKALKSRLVKVDEEKKNLDQELQKLQAKQEPLKQACSILTDRLEELAGFLDSLLTDRALLGLDVKQADAMKKVVDMSRELSRNLTLSLDDGTLLGDSAIIADQSLVISRLREQLSAVSKQVVKSELDSDVLSIHHDGNYSWFNCDLEEGDKKQLNLSVDKKKTVDKSDVRRLVFDASESESWSEPDRSVSLARMGRIDSASVTPLRLSKCAGSSGSSEETMNESKLSGKRPRSVESDSRRLQGKIKQLEDTNKTLREQITLLEKKQEIIDRLGVSDSGNDPLTEIVDKLRELDDVRFACRKLKDDLATTEEALLQAKLDLNFKEAICKEHTRAIDSLEAKNDEIVVDFELRLIEASEVNDALKRKACNREMKLKEAENERKELELKVEEIQKRIDETKRLETKSTAQVMEANKHLDAAERIKLESDREKEASDRKIKELQQFVDCLRKEINEKSKELEVWIKRTNKEMEETAEFKRRLLEAEKSKTAVELKVNEAKERIQWMECKVRELEQAMDQCDADVQARTAEEVRRGVDAEMAELRKNWVARVDLENTHKEMAVLDCELRRAQDQNRIMQEGFKKKEEALLRKIDLIRTENKDLSVQVNILKLQGSEMELELTRLNNEKHQLEEDLRKSIDKQHVLFRAQQEAEEKFQQQILKLEKQVEEESSLGAHSYVHNADLLLARNYNTSPDLGIESDQGRFSSLEHQDQQALVPRVNRTNLEAENAELRKRLVKMSQTLEETFAELAAANHHKRQMEQAICKQLHKTHHILKKARINFECQDSDSVDDRS